MFLIYSYGFIFCFQSGLDIGKMIIYKRRQEAKQKRRDKRAERRAKRKAKREVMLWKCGKTCGNIHCLQKCTKYFKDDIDFTRKSLNHFSLCLSTETSTEGS